jgi:hypothetical protein
VFFRANEVANVFLAVKHFRAWRKDKLEDCIINGCIEATPLEIKLCHLFNHLLSVGFGISANVVALSYRTDRQPKPRLDLRKVVLVPEPQFLLPRSDKKNVNCSGHETSGRIQVETKSVVGIRAPLIGVGRRIENNVIGIFRDGYRLGAARSDYFRIRSAVGHRSKKF